jgi:hypothetical protein
VAAPNLQAQGTIAASTDGGITVTNPAHAANDILMLSVAFWAPNTAGALGTIATPSGWTEIAQLSVAAAPDGQIAWFWLRATSGAETNPAVARPAGSDSGTDTCFAGRVYNIRGAATSGDPWDEADPTAVYTPGGQPFDAVTVSGTERMVVQFLNSTDNQSAGTVAGWTAGTAVTTNSGTDAGFQTFRKDNVSTSTTADTSGTLNPAQGGYAFLGVSFKPPGAATKAFPFQRRDPVLLMR